MDVREAVEFFLLRALVNGTVIGDFFLTGRASECRLREGRAAAGAVDRELSTQMEANGVASILFVFSQAGRLAQLLRL
jgi:hypothetical protein